MNEVLEMPAYTARFNHGGGFEVSCVNCNTTIGFPFGTVQEAYHRAHLHLDTWPEHMTTVHQVSVITKLKEPTCADASE